LSVWGRALELVSCTRSQSALASVAGSAEGATAVCWKPGATYVLAELRSATVDALVVSTRLYSTNLWGFGGGRQPRRCSARACHRRCTYVWTCPRKSWRAAGAPVSPVHGAVLPTAAN